MACLRGIIEHMVKHRYPMSRVTIACAYRLLTKEHSPEVDLARIVALADSQHKEEKAAKEALRRACAHHKVDLDTLIRDVTA